MGNNGLNCFTAADSAAVLGVVVVAENSIQKIGGLARKLLLLLYQRYTKIRQLPQPSAKSKELARGISSEAFK